MLPITNVCTHNFKVALMTVASEVVETRVLICDLCHQIFLTNHTFLLSAKCIIIIMHIHVHVYNIYLTNGSVPKISIHVLCTKLKKSLRRSCGFVISYTTLSLVPCQ